MKITYGIEEIADIVRTQAEKDLKSTNKKMTAGEITTEYISEDDGSGRELSSMTVEMEE